MDNDKLYIPYGLSIESEYFTGFGKTELRQCFVGMLFFGVLSALLLLITGEVASLVFTLLVGAAGSIMMTRKDSNTRISVVGQIGNIIRFSKSQKRYRYIYRSSWLYRS